MIFVSAFHAAIRADVCFIIDFFAAIFAICHITPPYAQIIQEENFLVKILQKFSSKIIGVDIGKVIKDLRQERNVSQMALAKAIGVSQKAIDYWERGVNQPKASYIVALADFFDVSCDFLLGRDK